MSEEDRFTVTETDDLGAPPERSTDRNSTGLVRRPQQGVSDPASDVLASAAGREGRPAVRPVPTYPHDTEQR